MRGLVILLYVLEIGIIGFKTRRTVGGRIVVADAFQDVPSLCRQYFRSIRYWDALNESSLPFKQHGSAHTQDD